MQRILKYSKIVKILLKHIFLNLSIFVKLLSKL